MSVYFFKDVAAVVAVVVVVVVVVAVVVVVDVDVVAFLLSFIILIRSNGW